MNEGIQGWAITEHPGQAVILHLTARSLCPVSLHLWLNSRRCSTRLTAPPHPGSQKGAQRQHRWAQGLLGTLLTMSDCRESSLSPLDPRLPSLAPQGSQVSSMEGTYQQAVGLESFSAPSGLENPSTAADTDGNPTPGPSPGSTFPSLSAPTGTELPGPCEHLWPLRMYQKQSLRAPEVPSHTKRASQSLWKCSYHWIHSPQK